MKNPEIKLQVIDEDRLAELLTLRAMNAAVAIVKADITEDKNSDNYKIEKALAEGNYAYSTMELSDHLKTCVHNNKYDTWANWKNKIFGEASETQKKYLTPVIGAVKEEVIDILSESVVRPKLSSPYYRRSNLKVEELRDTAGSIFKDIEELEVENKAWYDGWNEGMQKGFDYAANASKVVASTGAVMTYTGNPAGPGVAASGAVGYLTSQALKAYQGTMHEVAKYTITNPAQRRLEEERRKAEHMKQMNRRNQNRR